MMDITYSDILKIGISFALGAILGIEREYRNKPAGFRTLIMITVGATLFTILSYRINSTTPDRIAANIITGIGFIGAGVIFKEGMKVSGMTTAATIWMAAAVGMAVGYGAYYLAGGVTLVMLFTLILLSKLEGFFSKLHQVKFYKIVFLSNEFSLEELQKNLEEMGLNFRKDKEIKNKNEITVFYKFSAKQDEFEQLNNYLMQTRVISGFEM
jgi:putative Mg2+ transporter-C (MgtC) family protein